MRATARLALLLAVVFSVTSCSEPMPAASVSAPIAAGFDSADTVLVDYLQKLYEATTADPESGLARGTLGIAYDINGLTDAARLTYDQARVLDTTDVRWPYYLALLHASRGEHAVALRMIDTALLLAPDYVPALLWRGTLLLDMGQTSNAVSAFETARSQGAGAPATLGLARARLRLGEHDAAVQLLVPLAEETNHPAVFRLLGRAYQAGGQPHKAEVPLIRGRRSEPLMWFDALKFEQWEHAVSFTSRLGYAEILLALRRTDQAVDVLEALRPRDPNHEVLLNNLSSAYSQAGQEALAVATLKEGIAAHPDSFSFHLNLAYHHRHGGDDDLALAHSERALDLSPDLSQAHELIGEIMLARNQSEQATDAFEKAHSPRGYYYIAMLAGAAENWPRAIDYFERSVALDPANPLAQLYLGRSLAEEGRFDDASAALARANDLGASPDAFFSAISRLSSLRAR
jgi:tetratricopeptide (TPR) repeat protein